MDFSCSINVHSALTDDELADLIAIQEQGEVTGPTHVLTPYLSIDVDRNSDFKKDRKYEFPDGFLFFRHILYIDPVSDDIEFPVYRSKISDLLEFFWQRGEPAVAGCDFEHELPNNGGFKSIDVPWPTD